MKSETTKRLINGEITKRGAIGQSRPQCADLLTICSNLLIPFLGHRQPKGTKAMINYTATNTPNEMTTAKNIDVLRDVRDDVSGVAECLRSLSETARETAIEPASLALLADVLSFAADAVNESLNRL